MEHLLRHLQNQLWSQVLAAAMACKPWQTWALCPPLEASGLEFCGRV